MPGMVLLSLLLLLPPELLAHFPQGFLVHVGRHLEAPLEAEELAVFIGLIDAVLQSCQVPILVAALYELLDALLDLVLVPVEVGVVRAAGILPLMGLVVVVAAGSQRPVRHREHGLAAYGPPHQPAMPAGCTGVGVVGDEDA